MDRSRLWPNLALVLAFILCLTGMGPAQARAKARARALPRNVVLADLGLHVIGFGYQRTLSPTLAAQLALEPVYAPWTQNIDLFGVSGLAGGTYLSDLSGYAVRGRVFFYPSRQAPTGFWLSPFAQGGVGKATREGVKHAGPVWAVGASAGYAFLIRRALYIAVGGGVQFHAAEISGGDGPPSFHRLYPTLDANLGYAF